MPTTTVSRKRSTSSLAVLPQVRTIGVNDVHAKAIELVGDHDALHVRLRMEVVHASEEVQQGWSGGETVVAIDARAALGCGQVCAVLAELTVYRYSSGSVMSSI